MILDLHRQGLSVTAIARQLSLDRKTVRKYIARDLEPPANTPRPPRERCFAPFRAQRHTPVAGTQGAGLRVWLHRGDGLPPRRPALPLPFEVRFETSPSQQAQADFAHPVVTFTNEPGVTRIVWLFSMVLNHFGELVAALRLAPRPAVGSALPHRCFLLLKAAGKRSIRAEVHRQCPRTWMIGSRVQCTSG